MLHCRQVLHQQEPWCKVSKGSETLCQAGAQCDLKCLMTSQKISHPWGDAAMYVLFTVINDAHSNKWGCCHIHAQGRAQNHEAHMVLQNSCLRCPHQLQPSKFDAVYVTYVRVDKANLSEVVHPRVPDASDWLVTLRNS